MRRHPEVITRIPHSYARGREFRIFPHRGGWNRNPVYFYSPAIYMDPLAFNYVTDLPPVRNEVEIPIPPWIGKKLIPRGSVAPLDSIRKGLVILENQISVPYQVLGPQQYSRDFVRNRLTIYVNEQGIIQNLRYE